MKKEAAKSLRAFAIELAVYAALVTCYFFLVLHLLGDWLYQDGSSSSLPLCLGSPFAHRRSGHCPGRSDDAFISVFEGALEIAHVFPNLQHAHQSDLSGRSGFSDWDFRRLFGVGGRFIAGPALRLMGVDWNYAVGTDLAHIVGKSIVAARQHRTLGNVDFKLGLVHGLRNHRRRGRWRAVDSGAEACRPREHGGQLCSYRCLFFHRGIYALGKPKNTEIR